MKLFVLIFIGLTVWQAPRPGERQSHTLHAIDNSNQTRPRLGLNVSRDEGAKKERLVVDTDRSIIQWKGTKFWGARSHAGIVRLAEGSIVIRENSIVAGRFVLDMTTIEVTDIPKSDPVPRRRLREHLKHEHFFHVDRYPTALFEITSAQRNDSGLHQITGRLTMRGKTNSVTFDAHIPVLDGSALRATARFSINRHDWGVAYRGSRLTNDLVDDMIELNLVLAAEKRGES